jgi:hypothetical protein
MKGQNSDKRVRFDVNLGAGLRAGLGAAGGAGVEAAAGVVRSGSSASQFIK